MNLKKNQQNILNNKTILITGGTGSFGNKITEILLKEYNPKAIRIFSRGELKQHKMKVKFNSNKLRFLIGDVRDRNRLYRATNRVDIIIHTAALKHVPICEYNPIEAIRTNIDGAANVIDVAINNNVSKVMAISTDKAVYPVNLYGATKLVAEKLFTQGNVYQKKGITKFSCVRYGNVINSSGSVIPIFLKQKQKGVITITDKKMTRFWLTLEQAARFVISCIERMYGGEIFIPKIPSMKIMDLAKAIAPECEKKIIGTRPGEKLNETLITKEESAHTKGFNSYFVIEPEYHFWKKQYYGNKQFLPSNFVYTSNVNDWWLTIEDMKKMLKEDIK